MRHKKAVCQKQAPAHAHHYREQKAGLRQQLIIQMFSSVIAPLLVGIALQGIKGHEAPVGPSSVRTAPQASANHTDAQAERTDRPQQVAAVASGRTRQPVSRLQD